jgi:hypothetical protein
MIFEIPVTLSIDVPNDVQAKSLRDDLEKMLKGPMGKAFLDARGVRGVVVGQATPKR